MRDRLEELKPLGIEAIYDCLRDSHTNSHLTDLTAILSIGEKLYGT